MNQPHLTCKFHSFIGTQYDIDNCNDCQYLNDCKYAIRADNVSENVCTCYAGNCYAAEHCQVHRNN